MSKLSKALLPAAGNAAPQPAELYSLGEGTYGRLGNLANGVGNTAAATANVNTPFYGPWVDTSRTSFIDAASYFLIRDDGTLWVSGSGTAQSGVGVTYDTGNYYGLIQIGLDTDWLGAKITNTGNSVIAVKSNGTLWTWGLNSVGQLGQGDLVARSLPTQVGSDTTWVDAAMGNRFWIGVKSDGTLWACGDNAYGALGINASGSADKNSPVQVGALTDWAAVAVGEEHTIALKTNGTIWSWGRNIAGQLGLSLSNTVDKSSPVQIGSRTDWASVYAGMSSSFAIRTSGALWAWGDNSVGQLGIGTIAGKSSPVQVGAETYWDDIVYGGYYNFQLCSGTSAYYTGDRDFLISGTRRSSPVLIGSDIDFITHLTSYNQVSWNKSTLVPQVRLISYTGSPTLVGRGNGVNTSPNAIYKFPVPSVSYPIPIDTASNWIDASVAGYSLAAIREDGTLWVTGYNNLGQLGTGNTLPVSSPVQVGALTDWAKIRGNGLISGQGVFCFFAIKTDGTLWAWGNNTSGVLGDGTRVDKSSPVQIGALTDWVSIAGGSTHTLGLKTDGTLWSWGASAFGQGGRTVNTARSSPVKIGTLTDWAVIAAGGSNSAAIKTDGTLWTWGRGSDGTIGTNTTANRSSPVQVGALTDWSKVSVSVHALAVKTDGTLWAWGYNQYGQLGNNSKANTSSPVQIGSDTDWVDVATAAVRSYALKSNGSIYSFGLFAVGQTPVGVCADINFNSDQAVFGYSSPVQIGTNKTWSKIKDECFIT